MRESIQVYMCQITMEHHQQLVSLDDKVTSVEVSWSNPDVVLVPGQVGGTKKLWRSEDGENSFTETFLL